MTIPKILAELESKTHPVAKALFKGNKSKILAIGFKKDMVLAEHKTSSKAKLVVVQGAVQFMEDNKKTLLNQFDEIDIPLGEIHSVKALENSMCLLMMERIS